MMIAMNVAIGSDDNGRGRLLRWHLAYGLIVPPDRDNTEGSNVGRTSRVLKNCLRDK
jgi:hypothetical protein